MIQMIQQETFCVSIKSKQTKNTHTYTPNIYSLRIEGRKEEKKQNM